MLQPVSPKDLTEAFQSAFRDTQSGADPQFPIVKEEESMVKSVRKVRILEAVPNVICNVKNLFACKG